MKYYLSVFIFFLLPFFTRAQILKSVGVKGGISVANQIWTEGNYDSNDKKNRSGYYGTMSLEFFNSKNFSFITDLGYCEKGAKYNLDYVYWDPFGPPNQIHVKSTFTNSTVYLQFEPILISKVDFRNFIIFSLLGLRGDYLYSVYGEDNYTKIKTFGNKFIFGLTAGTGMKYRIKIICYNAEVKYQYDISHSVDYPPSSYGPYGKLKNKAFIISMGINIIFKKSISTNIENENNI